MEGSSEGADKELIVLDEHRDADFGQTAKTLEEKGENGEPLWTTIIPDTEKISKIHVIPEIVTFEQENPFNGEPDEREGVVVLVEGEDEVKGVYVESDAIRESVLKEEPLTWENLTKRQGAHRITNRDGYLKILTGRPATQAQVTETLQNRRDALKLPAEEAAS